MDNSTINTLDELRAYMKHKLHDDKDYAEMFDVFLEGNATNRFWIYPLGVEDGSSEPVLTIDYSLNGGGGWLNISMAYVEFMAVIDKIIEVWPLVDTLRDDIRAKKEALSCFVNR